MTSTIPEPPAARVAILASSFPTLSETFIIDQMASLIDSGLDARMVALTRATSGLVHDRSAQLVARSTFASDSPLWRLARLLPRPLRSRVRAAIQRRLDRQALREADLVLCHYGPTGLRAVTAAQGLTDAAPIFTIFHGYDITSYVRAHGASVYAPLFARGDRFLGVSEAWMERLRAMGCPADRIELLRMGVDVDAIAFAPSPIEDDEPVRIMTVGRLVEKKGTRYALEALAELRRRRTDIRWQYTIAGDGPLRSSLEALTAELGLASQVEFLGAVSAQEVQARLARAHVFMLPSVTAADGNMEGIPVALMEAMAAGTSVISTVHSGIPELIGHGVSGLLAPERDAPALADHLEALITDPQRRDAMLDRARAQVAIHFNQRALAQAFTARVHVRLARG